MSYFQDADNMPGAFGFDRESYPSGAKSNIFLPPSTPSEMSTNSSMYLMGTMASRKRSRMDETIYYSLEENDEDMGMAAPGSPMPFVNTTYRLAGGLDTPQQELQFREMRRDIDHVDIDYRRQLYEVKEGSEWDDNGHNQLYRDENGRAMIGEPVNIGWIKPVVDVVGGVVGKVWDFCTKSAFRGFQAGGGKPYVFGSSTPIEIEPKPFHNGTSDSIWEDEKSSRILNSTPGAYPNNGVTNGYFDSNYEYPTPTRERTPERPAKRRQLSFSAASTASTQDDMSRNWVVVTNPDIEREQRMFPARRDLVGGPKENFAAPPPFPPQNTNPRLQRPAPRYNLPTAASANRRIYNSPAVQRASNMSIPRRPASSLPRATATPVKHTPSPSASSRIPRWTPTPTPTKTAGAVTTMESPAAREARKWAATKLKEEREADESIRRLDRQLKAMIKEGKEALGTRVEVDMDVDGDDDGSVYVGNGIRRWGV